jgi:hypothetical protein
MAWGLLADAVLPLHFGFILFVCRGALLVRRRPWLIWPRLPVLAWGAWIEFSHGICPLTPLENHLRHLAGEAGYTGDFIGHYLLAAIYPEGLTPALQGLLGGLLLAGNATLYLALRRGREAHD